MSLVAAPPVLESVLPMLPTYAMTVNAVGGYWMVAHCKSHHEKRLAADLADAGFGYFLPLVKTARKSGAKRYTTYAPLDCLNGYVFCSSKGERETGYPAPRDLMQFLACYRSYFDLIEVRPSQQAGLVREMQTLYMAIVERRITVGGDIVKGRKCRVTTGPYMGREGIIDGVTGRGYALLPIETLGQVVTAQIPVEDLEAIDYAD